MAKRIKLDWNKIKENIVDGEKNKNFNKVDEREYRPKMKDDGTFQAVIRFLWSNDTDIPFVKKFSHGFQGVGGWYIEDCPTTIGKDCPTCKANGVEWNSGTEQGKDLARARARRLSCYSNILIVKDPQEPENEGKVFIYRYGKKLHDKIMEKIAPAEGSIEEPVMVFDPYEGANFKLIIKKIKVSGKKPQNNYDSSQFAAPTSLDDKQVEAIEKNLYGLKEFASPDMFKSFDELEMKFNKVNGQQASVTVESTPDESVSSDSDTSDNKDDVTDAVPAPGESDGDGDKSFFDGLRKDKEKGKGKGKGKKASAK